MDLSNSQYKLLKRIRKNKKIDLSSFSESEREDVSYLANNGLVHYESVYDEDKPLKILRTDAVIQPKGKAEYDTYRRVRLRWMIPLVISILALLVSIGAMYKSSQPINIHINTSMYTTTSSVTT